MATCGSPNTVNVNANMAGTTTASRMARCRAYQSGSSSRKRPASDGNGISTSGTGGAPLSRRGHPKPNPAAGGGA